MIIDAHCHVLPPDFADRRQELASRDLTFATLFPQSGGRIADGDSLLRDMDRAGVDRAVIMGFGWTDTEIAGAVNDYLIWTAQAHPERLSAFASVNPAWGQLALDELRRCLDDGAVGMGELHPDTQRFNIVAVDAMAPLMAELLARDLPVTIHASEPVGHQYPGKGATTPERLYAFARNFPDNRMVFAHLGGGLPFYAAMPEVAQELSNVWYDTAALPLLYRADAISAAVATAGSDHILFATDYPLLEHERAIAHVASAHLVPADRRAIMGHNAAALLGLSCQ